MPYIVYDSHVIVLHSLIEILILNEPMATSYALTFSLFLE